MTTRPSRLGAHSYETESSWAEATDTFGTRLQIIGEPTLPSDLQDRIAEPITQQYMEEAKMGVRGPWKDSQFTIRLALTGHGGTAAGSLTQTDLHALLANFFGGGSTSQVGTLVSASPTSASSFDVDGGTIEGGNLIRVGSLGDGRGNGQFAAVNSDAVTLLTALDATPAEGDVVYASQLIYPNEAPSGQSITSTRHLLQTANGQWKARGCFPMSAAVSGTTAGELVYIDLTYGVSRWEEANETFPSGTATDAKEGTLVAAGSCFMQDVGTVTRQKYSMRDWSLNIMMETSMLKGCSGVDQYQVTTGAVRTRCAASFDVTIDAEASGTNSLNDIFEAGVFQHVLITLSAVDGRALGFYFPNCRPTNYVTQESSDGLNRRTLSFEAMTNLSSANNRVMSSWRMGMA